MKKSVIVGAFGVFGVCALLPSCGSDDSASCDETRTCAPGTDGGSEGNAPADAGGGDGPVVVPEGCDPAADPKDAPKCVVSDYGIFVDATGGSDNNTGTKELPMKSIGAALKKLNGRPRIYVCEGTYAESVKLTSPVSIYGGFKCGTWSAPADPAKIAPGAAGIEAIIVENVKSPIILSDLAPESAAGTASARNSIAMRIVGSTDVKLVRVKATAQAGANGADGAPGTPGTLSAVMPVGSSMDLNGIAASGTTSGGQKTCTCSIGGATSGGNGGSANGNGQDGAPNLTGVAPKDGNGGKGMVSSCASGDGYGHDGADAPAASDATPLSVPGEIAVDTWSPANGADGTNGGVGQGGGGGGGKDTNNAGGSGGCGGCGGGGGKGGQGGGASIGILVSTSTVSATACEVRAADGGPGGAGGTGAAGMSGGNPGGSLCSGGQGGTGGHGGAGAGGAGGISVGVLYKGTKPAIDGATEGAITVGTPGAKGVGGNSPTNDGPVGVAEKVLGI